MTYVTSGNNTGAVTEAALLSVRARPSGPSRSIVTKDGTRSRLPAAGRRFFEEEGSRFAAISPVR